MAGGVWSGTLLLSGGEEDEAIADGGRGEGQACQGYSVSFSASLTSLWLYT